MSALRAEPGLCWMERYSFEALLFLLLLLTLKSSGPFIWMSKPLQEQIYLDCLEETFPGPARCFGLHKLLEIKFRNCLSSKNTQFTNVALCLLHYFGSVPALLK